MPSGTCGTGSLEMNHFVLRPPSLNVEGSGQDKLYNGKCVQGSLSCLLASSFMAFLEMSNTEEPEGQRPLSINYGLL